MKNNKNRDKKEVKQQKIIYKGVYISNERRKGQGGRIKCDQFQCKIQVMDFNPALHQSEVEWVEARRYVKGEKKEDKDKGNNGKDNKNYKNDKNDKKFDKNAKNDKNKDEKKGYNQKNNNKNNNFKQKLPNDSKEDYPSLTDNKKSQQSSNKKQGGMTNLVKKFKQSKLQTPQIIIQKKEETQIKTIQVSDNLKAQNIPPQKQQTKIITQTGTKITEDQTKFQQKQKIVKIESNRQQNQQRNIEDEQTQSQNDDDQRQENHKQVEKNQTVIKKQQTIVIEKIKVQGQKDKKQEKGKQGQEKEGQKEEKKQVQEVIVARIVKQTKIVYKDKRFVGILTCQKRDRMKHSFIEKDIRPIDKIMKDYFLDVTPIHSRLPKMQLDNLVVENIKVLTDYIEKFFPQKGKQLTNKKLNQILDLIQSIYVVASFGLWEGRRAYANIHQVIGKTMTIDGQCNCFLFEHHLNDFHYDQVKQENQNKKIVEICPSQIHKKFDKIVFSIDPSTSVDLDDALSIQKVSENLFQIGIHISDVSQYLKYIDRAELIKRTTSVYLPHKVYHMLTKDLMVISSLNPNVQRLAFSIFVNMNMNGQIVGQSRLQKNIIKSRYKLSYETVQDIITAKINYQGFLVKHPNTSPQQFQVLVEKLHDLTKIGMAHRQKRIKFQVFQNRQISFELDQNRWPIDISVQSRYTSKKIVEEYMIIGNVMAATQLIKNFGQNALIIYHPKPSDLAVKNFNETFKFLNRKFQFQDIHKVQQVFLQIQKDKTISEQVKQYMYYKGRRVQQTAGYKFYHEAVKQILDKSENKDPALIKNVHFALGQDFYTHFTSPMRRMADILVHETLSCLLYGTQPNKIPDDQIQKINLGRKHTKRLKKDLTQIYMCLMIYKTGKKIVQDGIITSFGLKSVSIYIPYFDMMKQIMWRDELQLNRVSKNRQNQDILDVCIYYDKKQASRDIIWQAKKYEKVKLIIDCTKRPPLRLSISLQVTTTKGKTQRIQAYNPEF